MRAIKVTYLTLGAALALPLLISTHRSLRHHLRMRSLERRAAALWPGALG